MRIKNCFVLAPQQFSVLFWNEPRQRHVWDMSELTYGRRCFFVVRFLVLFTNLLLLLLTLQNCDARLQKQRISLFFTKLLLLLWLTHTIQFLSSISNVYVKKKNSSYPPQNEIFLYSFSTIKVSNKYLSTRFWQKENFSWYSSYSCFIYIVLHGFGS